MPILQGSTLEALWERAEHAYTESRYAEAARLYAQLSRLLPPESPDWYTCQLHRAHCLRLAGSFRRALQLYRTLSQCTPGEGTATDALVGQALALRALGQLQPARQLLEEALQTYRQQHDTEGVLHTLWALGTTLRFAGDFRTASAYLKEALRLQRDSKLSSPTYILCALGGLSRMQGAPQRSLSYYRRAHAWALRHEDTFAIAYSACGIANAYRLLGNWGTAHHYFDIARLHYEAIGDRVSYAYTLWGEAMAYLLQRRLDLAEARCAAAETLFRQTEDRRGILHLALVRLQVEALDPARPGERLYHTLRQSLHWSRRYGYRFEELHFRLLGNVLGLLTEPLSSLRRAYRQCGSLWLQRLRTIQLPLNFP